MLDVLFCSREKAFRLYDERVGGSAYTADGKYLGLIVGWEEDEETDSDYYQVKVATTVPRDNGIGFLLHIKTKYAKDVYFDITEDRTRVKLEEKEVPVIVLDTPTNTVGKIDKPYESYAGRPIKFQSLDNSSETITERDNLEVTEGIKTFLNKHLGGRGILNPTLQ